MEKAYAKSLGSYALIDDKSILEILNDLTGFPVAKYELGFLVDEAETHHAFKELGELIDNGNIVAAICNGSIKSEEDPHRLLKPGHTYQI